MFKKIKKIIENYLKKLDILFKISLKSFLYLFFVLIVFSGTYNAYTLGTLGGIFYLALFALIVLVPVIIEDPNILNAGFEFGKLKISMEKQITEKEKEFTEETLKSDKSIEDKVKDTQKLIDEIFELGYKTGSGRNINRICNVEIKRDQNGQITGLEWDEN